MVGLLFNYFISKCDGRLLLDDLIEARSIMYEQKLRSPDGVFDRTSGEANQTNKMPIVLETVDVVTTVIVPPKYDTSQIGRSGQERGRCFIW